MTVGIYRSIGPKNALGAGTPRAFSAGNQPGRRARPGPRVPGIGPQTMRNILRARLDGALRDLGQLKKLGVDVGRGHAVHSPQRP